MISPEHPHKGQVHIPDGMSVDNRMPELFEIFMCKHSKRMRNKFQHRMVGWCINCPGSSDGFRSECNLSVKLVTEFHVTFLCSYLEILSAEAFRCLFYKQRDTIWPGNLPIMTFFCVVVL